MKRREFLSSGWRTANVAAFITLGGFVGSLGVTAGASGHPTAIVCYECRACVKDCPVNFDPAEFVLGARINNPDKLMPAEIDVEEYKMLTGKDITLYETGEDKQSLYELGNPYIQVIMGFKNEYGELIKDEFGKPVIKIDFLKNIIDENGYLRRGYEDAVLLRTYKMGAKEVAQFCLLCRLCSKNCPVGIEVTDFAMDLKLNGRYGNNPRVTGEL
ncbi:MAG: hypothetical protein SVM80_07870 [Halobacteriota archaeon]|nr:hypothetical protein [Halobacteriota archaeon]